MLIQFKASVVGILIMALLVAMILLLVGSITHIVIAMMLLILIAGFGSGLLVVELFEITRPRSSKVERQT